MTCQEFRRMVFIDPLKATRAERFAIFHHQRLCPDCSDYLFQKAEEAKRRLTETEIALQNKIAVALADQDATDPEAR